MRGKHFAALKLLLLPACVLGAGMAAAEDAPLPNPSPGLPATVLVLDAARSMGDKAGGAVKLDAARDAFGHAVTQYGDRFSFGLVAFGHRKASNCADSEILAKPGALNGESYEALLGGIKKAKGQAPIAAAISDAATLADPSGKPLDVILVADGGDTCDADICVTADALKQKTKGLRIHVIGLGDKPDELKPLACVAAATGGKFSTAATESELKERLDAVFAVIASPPTAVATAADGEESSTANGTVAPMAAQPMEPDLAAPGDADPGEASPGETAVLKSGAPAPRTAQTLVQRALPPPKPEPARPVPVTFKAKVTEVGPKLQGGITWRVYNSRPAADGSYELVSTHREPSPTAALLPGEYLVNAAYGLSNLTKKIKVEGGKSIEETFVLNTGGLALRAVLANGQPCAEGSIRFDIMSDEEDQFGNRATILADAKPQSVIRLNAGAYHVASLYGDANANVGVDVTVEPGRITEATIKHTGAKITFRLVQSLGGEALANTKWTILTSAGDTVKSNAGALPTHILAAGSYAVVADHGGLSYTRKFSIEPGDDKQIEVAIEDGPTSPEALQALLDPPEAPTPGTGALTGEGPGGAASFDGFSVRPADPNAPLINPGTLFRPSAR
jgi:hypothetical protein